MISTTRSAASLTLMVAVLALGGTSANGFEHSRIVATRSRLGSPATAGASMLWLKENPAYSDFPNDSFPNGNGNEIQPKPVVTQSAGPKSVAASVEKIANSVANLNFNAMRDNVDSVVTNTMSGSVGSRGEVWFALQGFIAFCILFGRVPFIGDGLNFLLGPVLLFIGLVFLLLSVSDLGDALSPWPKPPSTGRNLKTTGIYSLVRHPMYSGLLCSFFGFSVLTDSADRLLLTLFLYFVLDYKSQVEEEALLDLYLDDYEAYKAQVPGKFFPWATDATPETE